MIEIEYLVSSIEKEIYKFEIGFDCFRYVGFYISRRNDKYDVWGDEWGERYKELKQNELKVLNFGNDYEQAELEKEINDRYNPLLHKTKSGEPYYTGQYGGNLPTPKLTAAVIKKMILKVISEYKITI